MPTIDTIRDTAAKLGEEYGVDGMYLFGSFAKGTANENSDVDLRVDRGAIKTLIKLAGLHLALEDALGREVDLLPTDSLDEGFLQSIKPEEVLLYERN